MFSQYLINTHKDMHVCIHMIYTHQGCVNFSQQIEGVTSEKRSHDLNNCHEYVLLLCQ